MRISDWSSDVCSSDLGTVTSHSRVVTAAKSRVHPLVMERLDVSAASQLPRDDLTRQIGEIVREIVLDEKLNLNAPEQQAIVDIMLDDMLGLGPLEPLLADELVTDIMVNGPKQVYIRSEKHTSEIQSL